MFLYICSAEIDRNSNLDTILGGIFVPSVFRWPIGFRFGRGLSSDQSYDLLHSASTPASAVLIPDLTVSHPATKLQLTI